MFNFKNKPTPLPRNRIELLKDTLKYRLFELIVLSIYGFIFCLPSIIWLIFANYYFQGNNNIYVVIFINLINIIFIMIFGLAKGGIYYVCKKISFQEGENINQDFFLGIKKNYPMFLKIYFMIGLVYFFLQVALAISLNINGLESSTRGIIQGFIYTGFIIFIMIFDFMQTQTILYKGNFFCLFKNGLKFTFGMIKTNIPIFILMLFTFFIFELTPTIDGIYYFQYGVILFNGVFYFSFSSLIFSLYSNYVYDLTINKKQFKEYIKKGLQKDENNNL